MEIDAAIDALRAALAARGCDAPAPPEDDDALRALEAEIAPMTLPADVRRWWERIDPWTLPDLAFPQLGRPAAALDAWRDVRRDYRSTQPLTLALVGYESWNCLSVELDTPGVPGGAMYRYDFGSGGFSLTDRRFADWLARLTAAVAAGHDKDAIEPVLDEHVLEDRHDALCHWPRHWQAAAGLLPQDLEPARGATTTLRELLKSDPGRPATATLAGRVRIDPLDEDAGADASGGVRVRLDDGTKKVVLTGDARFVAYEVLGKGACFEVDLSLTPGRRRRRHLDAIATVDAIRFAHEREPE
jgi:hypothetical protein